MLVQRVITILELYILDAQSCMEINGLQTNGSNGCQTLKSFHVISIQNISMLNRLDKIQISLL